MSGCIDECSTLMHIRTYIDRGHTNLGEATLLEHYGVTYENLPIFQRSPRVQHTWVKVRQ